MRLDLREDEVNLVVLGPKFTYLLISSLRKEPLGHTLISNGPKLPGYRGTNIDQHRFGGMRDKPFFAAGMRDERQLEGGMRDV